MHCAVFRRLGRSTLAGRASLRVARGAAMYAAALLLGAGLAGTGAEAREWHFDVSLDSLSIGTYDVTVQENGKARTARGDMRFRVSILGLEAGSYEQHEEETWQADCLARLDTKTVEKGKTTSVSGRREGDGFVIDGASGSQRLPSCVMTFAYWNPLVLKQTKLVNVQTGAWTPVEVHALGKASYEVRGANVEATQYRIDTARNRIEVWYSPDGEWVGLRSTSQQGHVLTYRLK